MLLQVFFNINDSVILFHVFSSAYRHGLPSLLCGNHLVWSFTVHTEENVTLYQGCLYVVQALELIRFCSLGMTFLPKICISEYQNTNVLNFITVEPQICCEVRELESKQWTKKTQQTREAAISDSLCSILICPVRQPLLSFASLSWADQLLMLVMLR